MYLGRLMQLFIIFLVTVFISLGVNQFGVALSVVKGSSMRPTLHNGDRLLVNRFIPLLRTPGRGDVITFRDPSNEGKHLVKRVVGIAGDKIQVQDGVLFMNNKSKTERYTDTSIEDGNYGPIIVGPGTVFVMGDNRHRFASLDSRYEKMGVIPISCIDGKVSWILWRPSLEVNL